MAFSSVWDKISFLIIHMTVFELPVILAATALAALVLARVLDKHNARLREARLARRIAAFYAGLLAFLIVARYLLM